MSHQVLTVLDIERAEGNAAAGATVDGWGINMPVGSRIVGAGINNGALAVVLLMAPNALRVWHPVLVWPLNAAFTPQLGRKVGALLGTVQAGVDRLHIFEDSPWPKTALHGLPAAGEA